MKKKFLLFLCLLLTGICANAANWQPIGTDIPNVDLYIDTDSVRTINDNECLYAIKYTVAGQPEKVSYLRSNSKTNYLGVIYTIDYTPENYRPNGVFATPNAFMKPVKKTSFLNSAHRYAIAMTSDTKIAQNEYNAVYTQTESILREDIPVSYNNTSAMPAELQDYVIQVCKLLEKNWNPPASGKNSRAILLVTIGADGSLQKYSFAESSGDSITDRSIISAAGKTVPYPKFPARVKNAQALDFQFVFENDLLRKSVVY